ncbi:hypothetical protein KM043_002579 [Ampulex compressa]|nr:hypothetical protein KM043_002579 [Ampulex compressa]
MEFPFSKEGEGKWIDPRNCSPRFFRDEARPRGRSPAATRRRGSTALAGCRRNDANRLRSAERLSSPTADRSPRTPTTAHDATRALASIALATRIHWRLCRVPRWSPRDPCKYKKNDSIQHRPAVLNSKYKKNDSIQHRPAVFNSKYKSSDSIQHRLAVLDSKYKNNDSFQHRSAVFNSKYKNNDSVQQRSKTARVSNRDQKYPTATNGIQRCPTRSRRRRGQEQRRTAFDIDQQRVTASNASNNDEQRSTSTNSVAPHALTSQR